MNASETAQRFASEEDGRPVPPQYRRPTMLTWQGVPEQPPRLESVRLLLSDARLRASGRMVAAAGDGTEPFSASFELSVTEVGTVSRLLLRSTTAEEERQISLSRTEDGVWLADLGQGTERTDFDGAVDVDVQRAALFNTLPIRRLGLHREPGEHEIPMVFVSLPDLSVRLVRQTYRTVSVGAEQSVVNFTSGDFSADLVVDAEGLVLDYPGLATRR
ncbi:putative glycolipid-binding domain-containing protein [Gandjariella thermophila]|uniref:Uncharacterized protein n=1 Tax=Gandjariella thermophila TaxID=1931992 RepID=A0A4D4J9T1_9PSEU|nr:putative glycolipid-binding domain-containing protein [Gandjariella thermophila]GDY33421.1 hypothetical protein GTS_50540 [Gandjariella thermophila]